MKDYMKTYYVIEVMTNFNILERYFYDADDPKQFKEYALKSHELVARKRNHIIKDYEIYKLIPLGDNK